MLFKLYLLRVLIIHKISQTMNDSEQLIERKISSREVFKGELLHVYSDQARLPNGASSTREWIKHPGASAVLPVFENGDVMLVRQFRYPLRQIFYEVPAGKLDPGETPLSTAKRELEEEAGISCEKIQHLGPFYPSIGYTDEVIHLYVAWDLKTFDQNSDEDEFLLKARLQFREAFEMVHSGEISDGKTMVTVLKAWHWWQQNKPFSL